MCSLEIGSNYKVFVDKRLPLTFKLGKLLQIDGNYLKFVEFSLTIDEIEQIVHPTMHKLPCLILNHNLMFHVNKCAHLNLIYVVHKNYFLDRELIFHEGFRNTFTIEHEIILDSVVTSLVEKLQYPVSSSLLAFDSNLDHITDICYLNSVKNVDKCFSEFNFRCRLAELLTAALLNTKGDGTYSKF
jgi:hypothetical protein